MAKNVVIFYDDETAYIDEWIYILQENGFVVEIFISADYLLERVAKKTSDICLIVSELIVHGPGNNFGGRRRENHENCASYLLDEFDSSMSKDELSKIPKVVFTSWSHVKDGKMFNRMQSDPRVKMVLSKSDVLPSQFLQIVRGLVR